ncbi:hypothetical protein [Sinisalibacter aestuarii]|uniref:Peptidase metallopeptidase domain-containing protein n=1 Tax=Sinisalibacter aestuarii TaxID=2949426 RepID=A0ABQ5LNV7_9RHOB|nr:hypothetical protein [Sinisalibacter aestuarii]GKY86634.1 hypothetical protein STA1M1_05030 [Sinisalibacter aestuarii]
MELVSDYRALLSDYRWNGMTKTGTPVFVTYAFLTNSEVPTLDQYQPYENNGYSAFTAAQQASFRKAIAHYAKVTGIHFVEVDKPSDAMLMVMNAEGSDWGGWANYGIGERDFTSSGYLVIDSAGNYAPGSYSYETILHELGHAMGLKHPFDGELQLVARLDNQDHTLMSYTSNGVNDQALAHLDIDALTYIYGNPRAVRPDWDWWFDDRQHIFHLTGSGQADKLLGTNTESILDGRAGNDRLFGRDYDDIAYGRKGNDWFMLGDGFNMARGGKGSDRFINYWGDDEFRGGNGRDTVGFGLSLTGVTVDIGTTDEQFAMGNDRFFSIENVLGSNQDDTIFGSSIRNVLRGRPGDDVIYGRGGHDVIYGGNGNDQLWGGWGRDRLSAGAGTDTLTGAFGADTFVFRPDQGEATITDFEDRTDRIALSDFGFSTKNQAVAHFSELGTANDLQVEFDYHGTRIIIHGADLADISHADLLI